MSDKLDEAQLSELTGADPSIAIAECIEGLGCAVYANGSELPPWVSYRVQELVGIHMCDGAVISTQTKIRYFILKPDQETESFDVLYGPLRADEVLARRTTTRRATN